MSRRDNAFYHFIACKCLNVNQIDDAAFGERNVDIGIRLGLYGLFPTLFRGAECHEDRRILAHYGTELLPAINDRIDIVSFIKKINAPFKHIHWKRLRKLRLLDHSRSIKAA